MLRAVENALRARPKYEEVLEDEKIRKLEQQAGGRPLGSDILGRRRGAARPKNPTPGD
jgi:hypothetical protein